MSIENAFASVAVADLDAATDWYTRLLEREPSRPMPEVAEWTFPRGGVLQVYQTPERAGQGSCTLSVTDIDEVTARLDAMGVDTGDRPETATVRTLMVRDPAGNHVAVSQARGPAR
jgi:catechol 2,3-dioxygenase-like lactoylglutathione lyase family enzyme